MSRRIKLIWCWKGEYRWCPVDLRAHVEQGINILNYKLVFTLSPTWSPLYGAWTSTYPAIRPFLSGVKGLWKHNELPKCPDDFHISPPPLSLPKKKA